jgi:NAD(P)H-flavin reductase/hemoglobin-like flavoprotein
MWTDSRTPEEAAPRVVVDDTGRADLVDEIEHAHRGLPKDGNGAGPQVDDLVLNAPRREMPRNAPDFANGSTTTSGALFGAAELNVDDGSARAVHDTVELDRVGPPLDDDAGTLATEDGSTYLDIEALRESMALAERDRDRLGKEFYSLFFASDPDLRELFPAGMEAQRSRFVGALVRIVGSVDDRATLVPFLKALGRDHRKFGVVSRHYGTMGNALILALRRVLGEHWTPRYEAAWTEAFDAVALIMVKGADEDAVISPPWWDAEVVFHRRVLDDVAVIQVRPHTLYPYRPGQYCSLTMARRPKMWRSYSMASAPRDDGLLEFHVRAVGGGWVSSALVWKTEPGDIVRLGAPQGFDLANPRSEHDMLCIAGGTGIAPVLAGLQELEHRQDGRRVHVFYAGRDRDRLYALPHLESIGVRYRRLTVVPVVSPDGPEDRSSDVMGNVVSSYGDWRRHSVYVAGPTNMVQTTFDRLREQGIPESHIVFDDYGIS